MQLFANESELIRSGYIFRITDNGGATCDRFTVITSDGDYFASGTAPYNPQGFFQSGEGLDVQGVADRVENGEEHDLRWIDLPADVRRATFERINEGFRDYLEGNTIPTDRNAVDVNGDGFDLRNRIGEGLYSTPAGYMIKRDGDDASDDLGPYRDLWEAYRNTLPSNYDLSGPECHTTVDLTDETGGPAPLWDCDETPPRLYELAMICDAPAAYHWHKLGDFVTIDEARQEACGWLVDNPSLAPVARPSLQDKRTRKGFETFAL